MTTQKIDIQRDWTHTFECGCKVVWLGSCFHKSRRMTCCEQHNRRDQLELRTRMQGEAAGHYDLAMLGRDPPKYQDVADHPEDERIDMIGKAAMAGNKVAFITDSEAGKAERYIAKLLERFPELQVIDKNDGPVANSVTVRVCRKEVT